MVFQYLVFFVFSWSQLCPSNCFVFQVTLLPRGCHHGRDLLALWLPRGAM